MLKSGEGSISEPYRTEEIHREARESGLFVAVREG
jgi:hypothetical protein